MLRPNSLPPWIAKVAIAKTAIVIVAMSFATLPAPLSAQTTKFFTGIFTSDSWFDDGKWAPAGQPTPLDTAIVSSGPPFRLGTIADNPLPATALALIIGGDTGRGRIDQTGGMLHVGILALGTGATSLGEFNLTSGEVMADRIIAGAAGGALLDLSGVGKATSARMILGNGPAGTFEKTVYQTDFASNTVTGQLELGLLGPATYTHTGGTNKVLDLYITGPTHLGVDGFVAAGEADSTYRLNDEIEPIFDPLNLKFPTLDIGGKAHIGGVLIGGHTGTLSASGGVIVGSSPSSELIVHARHGRFLGSADVQIPTRYTDDAIFTADLRFAKGALKTSTALAIKPDLSAGNVAAGAVGDILMTLKAHLMAETTKNFVWGGVAGAPTDVVYSALAADTPKITMQFGVSAVTGNAQVSADNIRPRVRMLQFGQKLLSSSLNGSTITGASDKPGEIRNITDGPVAFFEAQGKSLNVGGDFDLALIGNAVTPRHQNPQFQRLHAAAGLTGKGVIIGQMEGGLPYLAHGAFDDWQSSDPTALRASYTGVVPATVTPSDHSTFVASLMIGYDPLGVQVDAQSRFEQTPANRYSDSGFGFTGIAPQAKLYSINTSLNPDSIGVTALAAIVEGSGASANHLKIINMSAGSGAPADGTNTRELAIDHVAEKNGIVFVKSAGNSGRSGGVTVYGSLTEPAGNYNGITVANAEFDVLTVGGLPVNNPYPMNFDVLHATLDPTSSRGPTAESAGGRAKPDLAAQGTGNLGAFLMTGVSAAGAFMLDPAYPIAGNRGLYSTQSRLGPGAFVAQSGTSFAAPTVSGTAALMVELARREHDPRREDPRVIKSTLQTTADKPFKADGAAVDWERGRDDMHADDSSRIPLSYDWGAGLLDPEQAISLLSRDRHPLGEHIHDDGWTLETIAPRTSVPEIPGHFGHFYIFDSLAIGKSFTATLNWFRHVSAHGTTEIDYAASPLVNLDLALYEWDGATLGSLVALSDSLVDNLEHLYIRSLAHGGGYALRVVGADFMGQEAETYALSWDVTAVVVPEPGALSLLAIGFFSIAVCRRKVARRAATSPTSSPTL